MTNSDSTGTGIAEKDPLIGRVVDGCLELRSVIGRGGMGTVYEAFHQSLHTTLAVKVLHRKLVHSRDAVLRLQSEARIASSLNHPNLIAINKFGFVDEDVPYFSMELINGITLSDLLAEKKTLNETEFLDIFKQCASGLQHAHDQGVVHRDIKPSNIMLVAKENGYQVRITDFGIAKALAAGEGSLQHLTQTGEVIGTPRYMSPEQCQSANLDHRSDIYSLACVMYEAVCGRPPFNSDSPYEVLMAHVKSVPPPPVSHEQCLLKALEKDPNMRQQSMRELARELESAEAGAPQQRPGSIVGTALPRRPSNEARPLKSKVAVVLLMLVAVAASVFLFFRTQPTVGRSVAAHQYETYLQLERAIEKQRNESHDTDPHRMNVAEWTKIVDSFESLVAGPGHRPSPLAITVGLLSEAKDTEQKVKELPFSPELAAELEIAARIRHTMGNKYAELALGPDYRVWAVRPWEDARHHFDNATEDLKILCKANAANRQQYQTELDKVTADKMHFETEYAKTRGTPL